MESTCTGNSAKYDGRGGPNQDICKRGEDEEVGDASVLNFTASVQRQVAEGQMQKYLYTISDIQQGDAYHVIKIDIAD